MQVVEPEAGHFVDGLLAGYSSFDPGLEPAERWSDCCQAERNTDPARSQLRFR